MKRHTSRAFSVLELLLVMAIMGILGAIAVPTFLNSLTGYRLNAAVTAVAGAIQATRFQAIAEGYQYQLVLTSSALSYQVSDMVPPATTFSNVGSPVPMARMGDVTLNGTSFTYTFLANGTVQGPSTNLCISNGIASDTITVSGVGYVSITSP